MNHLLTISLIGLLFCPGLVSAQQPLDLAQIVETLDKQGQVTLDQGQVLILKYDYTVEGDAVEAIAFRPAAEGKYPAVLLIPGYSRTVQVATTPLALAG
jgi:hypothetical protein